MLIGIEAAHANKKYRTGVEEVCWQVIQNLKEVIPLDQRVVLYSNKPLEGEFGDLPTNWSVKILRWPFKKGWSQIRLSLEFLFHSPDIFFAPGQLVPFICPRNTISIVHDSAFLAFPQVYWWASRWYLNLMNRLIIKKSKLIITPSQFNKQELLKYYNYPADKVKVIPWGYDQNKFKVLEPDLSILKKYNLIKPFIMSIGRLEEKKNSKEIIKAFNLIKKNNDIQLLLVGTPGVGYNQIEAVIRNSPYKQDIIIPGWVDNDLVQLLNQAQAFVFPSLYEGFGLPVLEAMACGCPVVCSQTASLPEVGGDGLTYVEVKSEEGLSQEIKKILTDNGYCQKQIDYELQRIKEFTWIKTVREIWKTLKFS